MYARQKPNAIDEVLARSTQASLLAALKKTGLPDQFSPRQQQVIVNLLDKYHPQTLSRSPLIDVQGRPIPLKLAPEPLTGPFGEKLSPNDPVSRGLMRMISHFPEHQRWESANLAVRTIRPGQAEAELVGQEGVFAKKDIPADTPVSVFGGLFLDHPEDIALNDDVRSMAGLRPNKYQDSEVSKRGNVMEGMGIAMKCNSNEHRHNLLPTTITVIAPSGEKLYLMVLRTSRNIKAGEELTMTYHDQLRQDNQL